ncbi:MAG: hypothetical protein H0W25_18265 [Acidimicrobiia bacterium]|nr:hypothetical protein [Acidimicrobiia bacterium]
MTDDKGPIERLLDVFVYAPLGFVMNLDEIVPQLVEKGHQQVTMARMFGQFAVEDEGRKQVQKLQAQAAGLVGQLAEQAAAVTGRKPSASAPSRPAATAAPAPEAASTTATKAPAADAADPGPGTGELAIPDYDSLSASQVVPRLDGLAGPELDLVRRYEAAHRGRKTILSKIAQLQS